MMKIAIFLLVAFVASSNAWSMNPRWADWFSFPAWKRAVTNESLPLHESECVFFRAEGVLGCVNVDRRVVECPAVMNMTELDQSMFSSFIVGIDSSLSFDSVSKFSLYPSLSEYPYYLVSKMGLRGIPIEFCLHDQVDLPVFGLRVTESSCFAQLLDMARKCGSDNVVTLRSFEIEKPTAIQFTHLFVV
ncbi:hypothetical protein BpHYR1_033199 [Brachionus plicatilis]|uniref:Uncharacterized protein n=1 Tax=Brachionus plicatilis TaxID=10195 RepID=A0A3M7S6S3_BRAPC|nr:hypothetical protein BpHYR1_033199 [Brachionus plicatilis]